MAVKDGQGNILYDGVDEEVVVKSGTGKVLYNYRQPIITTEVFERVKKELLDQIANLSQSPQEYEWTASAGQLIYNLPAGKEYDPDTNWLQVSIGGGLVAPSMIEKTSATRFTLKVPTSDVPLNAKVVARWMQPVVGGLARVQLVPNEQEFTSTLNQDTFVLTNGSYTPGAKTLHVIIEGVYQSRSSFIEVDSTTFKLDTKLPAGLKVVAEWLEGRIN
jgi:hypothetical protein